jgi:hypothetical protein
VNLSIPVTDFRVGGRILTDLSASSGLPLTINTRYSL